jgi:hypothetical protein
MAPRQLVASQQSGKRQRTSFDSRKGTAWPRGPSSASMTAAATADMLLQCLVISSPICSRQLERTPQPQFYSVPDLHHTLLCPSLFCFLSTNPTALLPQLFCSGLFLLTPIVFFPFIVLPQQHYLELQVLRRYPGRPWQWSLATMELSCEQQGTAKAWVAQIQAALQQLDNR